MCMQCMQARHHVCHKYHAVCTNRSKRQICSYRWCSHYNVLGKMDDFPGPWPIVCISVQNWYIYTSVRFCLFRELEPHQNFWESQNFSIPSASVAINSMKSLVLGNQSESIWLHHDQQGATARNFTKPSQNGCLMLTIQ